LVSLGYDHTDIMLLKNIKYEVLCEVKTKMNIWLSKKVTNKWLQMEILKLIVPYFAEWEIMTILRIIK